jgi:hypothetical protein
MLPAVFEPAILASERPKTHALDRTATGIGVENIVMWYIRFSPWIFTDILLAAIIVNIC